MQPEKRWSLEEVQEAFDRMHDILAEDNLNVTMTTASRRSVSPIPHVASPGLSSSVNSPYTHASGSGELGSSSTTATTADFQPSRQSSGEGMESNPALAAERKASLVPSVGCMSGATHWITPESSICSDRRASMQQQRQQSHHLHRSPAQITTPQPLTWFDDTPANDFDSASHKREFSNFSVATSFTAAESTSNSGWAEAKRSDKIELFLRCSKAEAAYKTLQMQAELEREALLDALAEARRVAAGLKEERDGLLAQRASCRCR